MMNLNSILFSLLIAAVVLSSCSRKERVKIETEYGDMIVELRDDTPQHKENFLKLAEEGFYNDLLFHRVMSGFMIQGGDPNSKNAPSGQMLGGGGPGYTIPAEFTGGLHVKGALSAARLGDQQNPARASSGSQFFVVHGSPINSQNLEQHLGRNPNKNYTSEERQAYLDAGMGAPFLDDNYTVFGQVVEGLDVIDKIVAQPVDRNNRPLEDIKMKVSVIR